MILNNYYPQTGHSQLESVLTDKPDVKSMSFTMDTTNSVSYEAMKLFQ
jgi:hypothetical protein